MNTKFALLLILSALLVGCSLETSTYQPANTGSSSPREVISNSGAGAKVSPDFTISGNCANGILEYGGKQIKPKVNSAWVNFRIYDIKISEYSVERSGVHKLMPTGSGSTRVSLDSGTYYVEVESFNAEWQYSITCR